MIGKKNKLRRKQIKLDLHFVLNCLIIIFCEAISFCYFISCENYLTTAFTVLFTYYPIQLYAVNYFDID